MLNNTIGGYMHNVLHVHLSNGKLTYQTPNDETLRRYLGGTGMGAKHLYDEVSPGVEWSDAENRLIFFSGPFGGTKVSGSGTFSVVTKGPMTNLAGASQANGFFGAFLKFSGFDGVSIQGKARKWQYLLINNGSGELRDAEHLKGKDTWETEDAIKKEIGKQCSVYCIGPAGENRVRFASIVGDHGHVVAHNGMGAVMGSKKLKAIVTVRGKQSVPIANPEQLTSASQALYEHAAKSDSNLGPWGTAWSLPGVMSAGILPVRNYTTNIFPEAEKLSGKYLRTHFKTTPTTCWACRMNHCRITEVTEGPYTGFVGEEPEYEGIAAMSSQIGQSDPGATVMLGNEIDRLGMDINESGWLIGWMMECYEKGLLKKEDFDGIEMKWGNVEGTKQMLRRIANREGNGDLWAEGVKRAAEKIGGDTKNFAVYTQKGASPRGHDHRAMWNELIDTCLSNTSTIQNAGGGFFDVTELGLTPLKEKFDPIAVSSMNAKLSGRNQFIDCLGGCYFCMLSMPLMIETLNAITGWDFDIKEAIEVGRRLINQLRVFNIRHGLSKDIEAPSSRYGSAPVDGPNQGLTIMPNWDSIRSNYYNNMGWDVKTGKPLPETLEQLGLANLVTDLYTVDK